MGNPFSKFLTPDSRHQNDMEWNAKTIPPEVNEKALYLDRKCFIRDDETNVYIVAPTDCDFYNDVQRFQEFMFESTPGMQLNNLCKQYSIDQLQLGTAEEMITNDIITTTNGEDEEENDYEVSTPRKQNVYNRKQETQPGHKSYSRINLLTVFPIEYHKWLSKEKDEEIAKLKEEILALKRK